MASLSARIYRPIVSQIGKQLAAADTAEKQRKVFARAGTLLLPSPGTQQEHTTLGGVKGLRVTPRNYDTGPQILMFHGGGYVFGTPSAYAPLAGRLAKAASACVHIIDYRLAPEHPYPAAPEDGLAAYRALLEQAAPENIALYGDSAGGNLVLTTLQRARDAGLPMPACAVMLSPWLDPSGSGESMRSNAKSEILILPETIARCARWYAGETDPRDPGISPLFGSQAGLPPLLVQASENEMLYSDTTRFAEQAAKAGVTLRLETEPDLWHVWQLMAPGLTEARQAIASAGAFIAEHTTGG